MTQTKQVEQLKLNVTNIHSFLVKENKRKEKLSAKKEDDKKRKITFQKQQQKEKQLEAKKATNSKKDAGEQVIKTSSMSLLDKLFNFGGLLLGGILVNAADGIVKEGKKFVKDNQELFDTIGGFLNGVKDAAVGFFDSITGEYSKEGAFDDFAKFSDDGKLQSGALKKVEDAYNGFADLINTIDKALGGSGKIADPMKTYNTQEPSANRSSLIEQTERGSGMTSFREDAAENAALQKSVRAATSAEENTSPSKPSTGPVDAAHGAGAGSPLSKTGFVAGKGDGSKRIFLHWSAGSHTTAYDAYHSIALGDGTIVRHTPYSDYKGTHTGGGNSNSVGLAIAAAAGAQERGKLGQYAPTEAQLDAMIYDAAKLALEWGWSESTVDSNVRTHGEWERYATRNGILPGSPQRWDLDRLRDSHPFIDTSKVLSAGGNELRERIKATLRSLKNQKISSTGETKIRPAPNNKDDQARVLNQRDPRGGGGFTTVAFQRVNTVQPVPYMMPFPVASKGSSSASTPQLSALWT